MKRKEGELSELHKKLLDPARFDYDPDFARAGSLQFMHPLQCSKGSHNFPSYFHRASQNDNVF